jgi:hypothetical protein
MFEIPSNFIGTFKIGDNINHNLGILQVLYRSYAAATPDDQRRLCKPITITLVSIVEACLYDFHKRARTNMWEGIAGLAGTALDYIRTKHIDQFEACITSARKHRLFGADDPFYEDLTLLRKLRNRIHIQNRWNELEPDEWNAFTQQRKVLAERALEKVAKTLSSQHPRPPHIHGYVAKFICPWTEHLIGKL